MKNVFIILTFFMVSIPNSFSQTPLDTLYYVDGKIETVQLTTITDNEVHYNYYGEEISIIALKNKFEKIVTHSGRVMIISKNSKVKKVFTAEDWVKVDITYYEADVEGLIRYRNVRGRVKGNNVFSSNTKDGKKYKNATKILRMQAAFLGCDHVLLLFQTNVSSAWGSTRGYSSFDGTGYGIKRIKPTEKISGNYILKKGYRLKANQYEYSEVPIHLLNKNLTIDINNFSEDENYYVIDFDSGIPNSQNLMRLLKVTNDELVFLVIENGDSEKFINYYNLYFSKDKSKM